MSLLPKRKLKIYNYINGIIILCCYSILVHATTSKETCQQTKTTKNNNHLHILGNSNRQSNKSINVDHNKVPIITTAAADKPNNEVQSERNTMEKSSSNENQLQNIKTTRSTQTTNSSGSTRSKRLHLTSSTRTTSSGRTTTSCTSSSNDLPTQKTLRKNIVNEDMDGVDGGDQSTMREWLNPLTQSEIEYEEKKREGKEEKAAKASPLKHDRDTKKLKQSKDISSTDRNRDQQLNWIEKEIHRLESLKHLLLKDGHEKSPSTTVSQSHTDESCNRIKDSCNSTQGNKLYDTVYSDTSSVLSESAERLVKEIEVILEESSGDITHLNDNTTRTRERKKETQILAEGFRRKPKSSTKELITINENVPVPLTRPEQRQKMKTPIITDQEGSGSASLRDMVKQRKNEFMASYKTKKQIHYDALKQQQKEENVFKYLPIKDGTMPVIKERKPSAYTAGYYSVPHTMNRKFSPTEYAYPQSNLPPTPEGPEEEATNSSGHVVYSTTRTAANLFQTKKDIHKPLASSTVTTTTASSSISMFCMSSDVSVPMGSNNVSSTPTTTHHYDDVAAAVAGAGGVAIQTSDSILCTQPILGHQLQPYFHSKRSGRAPIQPTISKAAAIQVKPKGIAYVIEFDNKKYNEENSSVPVKVVKHASNESVVTFTTNNINQLEKLSSEPQLTLQEHLEKAKPNFLKQSKERNAILNQLQAMRQERDRQLRDIIENTSFNSLERRLKYLPPPPIRKLQL